MIIEIIVQTIISVVELPFSILPNIPATPPAIQSVLDTIISYIYHGRLFINYIYGETLVNVLMVSVIAMFIFKHSYHLIMFILRKLPIGVK